MTTGMDPDRPDIFNTAWDAFQRLAETCPIGIFTADITGQHVFVNRTWSELTGIPRNEALGRGWERVVHPDDIAAVTRQWRQLVTEGGDLSIQVRLVRPDGTAFTAIMQATAVAGEDGDRRFAGTLTAVPRQPVHTALPAEPPALPPAVAPSRGGALAEVAESFELLDAPGPLTELDHIDWFHRFGGFDLLNQDPVNQDLINQDLINQDIGSRDISGQGIINQHGIDQNGGNGHDRPGPGPDGTGLDGPVLDGSPAHPGPDQADSGHPAQEQAGLGPDRRGADGYAPDGYGSAGYGLDGHLPGSYALDGYLSDGYGPDGYGPAGYPPDAYLPRTAGQAGADHLGGGEPLDDRGRQDEIGYRDVGYRDSLGDHPEDLSRPAGLGHGGVADGGFPTRLGPEGVGPGEGPMRAADQYRWSFPSPRSPHSEYGGSRWRDDRGDPPYSVRGPLPLGAEWRAAVAGHRDDEAILSRRATDPGGCGCAFAELSRLSDACYDRERWLTTLLAELPAAVLIADEHARVVAANQAYCDLFELADTPVDLVGTDCRAQLRPIAGLVDDPSAFAARLDQLLRRRRTVRREQVMFADGRVFERSHIPLADPEGYRGHIWLYVDVTERRIVEAEIEGLISGL